MKEPGSATSTTRTADQTADRPVLGRRRRARTRRRATGTRSPTRSRRPQGNSLADNARLLRRAQRRPGRRRDRRLGRQVHLQLLAADHGDPERRHRRQPGDGTADPTWTPLLITPPFPEYISGHSTFSAAAADASWPRSSATPVDLHDSARRALPGVTRSFTSFDAAAEEAGQSRIYGGIHFEFSNQDGLATGRTVGDYVLQRSPRRPTPSRRRSSSTAR